MAKHWIEFIDDLTAADLTVRAQAVDPTDRGMLKWQTFFPRRDVPSTELQDVMTLDDRFVSDRREWDAQGRQIPIRLPDLRKLDFTPIQAYQSIGEKEMQKLSQGLNANQAAVAQIIGFSLPDRVESMARANYRRLEIDCVTAWTSGKIVQMNPETGATFDISYNFDSGRITTVGTAWSDGGVNAYNEFVAAMVDAQTALGGIAGVVMPRAVLDVILADSPVNAISGRRLKLAELNQDIQDEIGSNFIIGIWEDRLDVFQDGGQDSAVRTRVFPAASLAVVPAGGNIGSAAFAPVVRADDVATNSDAPEGVDANGQRMYYVTKNEGMQLKPVVQMNAFPVPDEENVFVLKGLIA
ncbi:MAG TPA: major capsid protein [Pyrinomonadaceae bacterium]|jgi:hypothetical protein